jgi:Reverse transcriptase (RNA-dependent DNA polymerase)
MWTRPSSRYNLAGRASLRPEGDSLSIRVDPIVSRWQPKPGGFRRMAVLSDRDAARWAALAGRAGVALEARLDPRVLANRVETSRSGWRVEPVGSALHRARPTAPAMASRHRSLLRTDVRSFYPTVDPSVLYRALVAAGVAGRVATAAAAMVEGWGSEGHGGLPIGPPGSAVMANAVLRPVDDAVAMVPYLRWVDDYLIAASDPAEAARLVEQVDQALDRLGLVRSEPKTALVTLGPGAVWPGGRNSRPGDPSH